MAELWVLVADHARARLFEVDGGWMSESTDFINAEARVPGHDRVRAPPPRTHDRLGTTRHTIEAHTAPRDKIAARFAGTLKSTLERGKAAGAYRSLVLVAPPRFMGILNKALGAELGNRVVLRIAKNLTRATPDAICAELSRARSNVVSTTR